MRKYLHNEKEAEPYGQEPGTFTPWNEIESGTDLLLYEGLHGESHPALIEVLNNYAYLLNARNVVVADHHKSVFVHPVKGPPGGLQ